MMVNKSKVFPLKRILEVKSLNRLGEFDGQLDDIRPRKVDTNFLVLAGWHIGVTITGVVRFQFYWDQQFYVGWVFRCSLGKKPFSVGFISQLFQPASNLVETVEKVWPATAVVNAGFLKSVAGSSHDLSTQRNLVMTIPRCYCVQPKTVRKVFYWKRQPLQSKAVTVETLIPTEHNLSFIYIIYSVAGRTGNT